MTIIRNELCELNEGVMVDLTELVERAVACGEIPGSIAAIGINGITDQCVVD